MRRFGIPFTVMAMLVCLVALSSKICGAQPMNVELIIDASGSMAARLEGRSKMDIAKEVLTGLLADLPQDAQVAVRAYGHRKKDDCNDLELLAPFGPKDSRQIEGKVQALKPVGMTPITGALEAAAKDFNGWESQRNVVILVSDGEETCKRDPCALVGDLRRAGVQVEVNVIGFDVRGDERKQLECIAKAGGGKYYNASNAGEFRLAAMEVKQQVLQSQPTPPPVKPPEQSKQINLLAPENGGELVAASDDEWLKTIDGKTEPTKDYLDIKKGQEGVYAFKDEQAATFETFSAFIPGADDNNLKEFELLVGDESATGKFSSIGKFQLQNVKVLKTGGYQEFKFPAVTAKYFKVTLVSTQGGSRWVYLYEFRLLGAVHAGGGR